MMGAWYKACGDDVAKFCKDVPAGQGRIAQCLFGHTEQLSPACKAALESRPHLRLTPGAAATPPPTAKP